jgi:hypothetical protein
MVLNVLSDTETEDASTAIMSEANNQDNRGGGGGGLLLRGEQRERAPPNDETWERVDRNGEVPGVLIVPGEGDVVAGAAEGAPPPPALNPGAVDRFIELDLSYPESVPSELGSVQNSGVVNGDRAAPPPPEPRGDDVVLRLHRRLAIRRSHLTMAVTAVLLLFVSLAYTTIWIERSNLRIENLQLKRDLLEAREKPKIKQVAAAAPLRPLPPAPPACTCGAQQDPADHGDDSTTTLVDNCWFHAKANVQLGRCAEEAKAVVHDKIGAFQRGIRGLADDWLAPPKEQAPGAPRSDETTEGGGEGTGISFQGVREAAKILFSGVAFVTVTSLLDEAIGLLLEKPGAEDPADK